MHTRMKHVLRVVGMMTLAIGAFAFDGCSVFDPAEEIPSYVQINSISLQINNSTIEGTSSHKITDAWVYIDGELIGAFEMPVNIPVLKEGTHSIIVFAGVKQNGMSSTRALYSKYKGWEGTITLTRGQITTVSPVVQYFPSTNFVWMCDFDDVGTNIDDSTNAPYPNILQEVSAPLAFEDESGFVQLNASMTQFYAQSNLAFLLDIGQDVYLEMNYKCNQSFVVGVHNSTTQSFYASNSISASDSWNKIYLRLNDALQIDPQGYTFYIYIAMQKDATVDTPELYIDEIKLIN